MSTRVIVRSSPTYAYVIKEVERRVPGAAYEYVRAAIGDACTAVMERPHELPGHWYGEQVVLEAVRRLSEKSAC